MKINLWDLFEKLIKNSEVIEVEEEKQESFYMIYVDWWNNPKVCYAWLEEVKQEAKRLCEKENKETFVLKAIKSFKNNNIIEIDL